MIQPSLRWPLITLPIDVLIAVNLLGHYYLACTVSPGFVGAPPTVEGSGLTWARRRHGVDRDDATTAVHHGVRWTEYESLNITPAEITRCRKCGVQRPEVCFNFVLNTPQRASHLVSHPFCLCFYLREPIIAASAIAAF